MADGDQITLLPGELWFGDGPASVTTLLGSCVAITLWHPGRRLGGMCHYLLGQADTRRGPQSQPGRYATDAATWLHERISRCGTGPQQYQTKMFGGGNMFAQIARGRAPSVAQTNVTDGVRIFEQLGFQVQVMDVGGERCRTVTLHLGTGEVWVRYGPRRRDGAAAPLGSVR